MVIALSIRVVIYKVTYVQAVSIKSGLGGDPVRHKEKIIWFGDQQFDPH